MMTLTTTAIRKAVLDLFDENGGDVSFMAIDDTNNELYSIIDTVVESAVHKIHLQAPNPMLDGVQMNVSNGFTELSINGRWVAKFELPQDFFRIVSIRMVDWKKNATTLLYEDSAEYAKQKNKYMMGTADKPMAFIVHQNGKSYCELYSSKTSSSCAGYYIARPTYSDKTGIEICDRLYWPCIYQIAADALKAVNESQKAQIYESMAERYFATYSNVERKTTDIGTRIEQ